jgi:hypothetical protein
MLLLLLIVMMLLGQSAATCQFINSTQSYSSNLTCTEFNSWSEVNDEFSSIKNSNNPNPISLKPSELILLTSELNITRVAYSYDLFLYGVSGINVYPWPALSFTCCFEKGLNLFFSTIEFYVNSKPPSDYTCSPALIPDNTTASVSLFSKYLQGITLHYGNTYGSSSRTVCPYLFKNAQISSMQLNYQVDSFLFVTLFRFQNDSIATRLMIPRNFPFAQILAYWMC